MEDITDEIHEWFVVWYNTLGHYDVFPAADFGGRSAWLPIREKEKERSLIARYKYGNEMRRSQHWRKKNERTCRVCGSGEENIIHVLKECKATKDKMPIEEFLSKEGKGCSAIKRINKVREEKKRKEKERKAEVWRSKGRKKEESGEIEIEVGLRLLIITTVI